MSLVMDDFSAIFDAVRASYVHIGCPTPILAGLSGGADSVLLLHALTQLRTEMHFELQAVHVNHGLRENAQLDEEFCKLLCETLHVPLKISHVKVERHGSVEDAARRARYEAFDRALCSQDGGVLALAHHMDDQAETVLMHLIHGSGMTGLSGMKELNVSFWRPLLSIRRAQIRSALKGISQSWREDESNQDTAYTRNYIRAYALPALEQADPSAVSSICRAAAILSQEDMLLSDMAKRALEGACGKGRHRFILLSALHNQEPAMQNRMLRTYAMQTGLPLSYEQTMRLQALTEAAENSYENLPENWRAMRTRTRLHLLPPSPVKPVLDPSLLHILPCADRLGDGIRMQAIPDNLLEQGIALRTRQAGDYICPFGKCGTKKLKDYMIDHHIDQPFRDDWPLVCRGSEVLWMVGVGASEKLRISACCTNKAKMMMYAGTLPDAI